MIDIAKIRYDKDTQLMLKVKSGNVQAYATLYKNHISDVISFFKMVGNADGWSEDLAQDVFTCILKEKESFRAESTFKTYMYGVAKKILSTHRRKLNRDVERVNFSGSSNKKKLFSEPEAAFSYKELFKNIEKCKSKLPKKQRQAIELSLKPDFTPEKAAKLDHCSNNTYLKRLSDARKQIKKQFENTLHIPCNYKHL